MHHSFINLFKLKCALYHLSGLAGILFSYSSASMSVYVKAREREREREGGGGDTSEFTSVGCLTVPSPVLQGVWHTLNNKFLSVPDGKCCVHILIGHHFLFVADAIIYRLFYLKIYFIHHHFRFYNVWIYPLSHSATKTIRAPCYHWFYFDFPSPLLAAASDNPANTLFTHIYIGFTVTCFNGGLCLPLSEGEDMFELHLVQLELEAVEKQNRELLGKQAQPRERRAMLETSRADAYKSGEICSVLLTLPPPLLRVFLCTGPVHPGRDLPRCPSLRRGETTDPVCSSRGRCEPGPEWRPLPLRRLRSSRSPPETASFLSARRNVALWLPVTPSSGTSVLC